MKELLREIINNSIEKKEVAGVSLLVEREGQELCFLAEGMADIENGKPIQRDTIYRLYSQTKPVCGVAAMVLVERGVLDLWQPISDYLPAFHGQMVYADGEKRPASREITVHDLLSMTSGLSYPDDICESGRDVTALFQKLDDRLQGDNPMSTIELANALAGCTLRFDPGSSWAYGTSADVLGAVIEVAAQMPFAEFMKKEIFEPLGMNDTGFWVPEEKQGRLAEVYETVSNGNEKSLLHYTGNHLGIHNRMHREPAFASGGAGLASTLDDYMKLSRMLLNQGELDGVRILRPETVRHFTNGQLLDHQQQVYEQTMWPGFGFGNLVRVCNRPGQSVTLARTGEYGWGGWLGTHFANFPNEKMTILIGMQKKDAGTWSLTRKLRNAIVSFM